MRRFLYVCLYSLFLGGAWLSKADASFIFTTIDVFGSPSTGAQDIYNAGLRVASFGDATGFYGFLDTGGSFGKIAVPGITDSAAMDINATGQIVGFFLDDTGHRHGFLDTGGNFRTLDVPGSIHTEAFGINDAGQIVGQFFDATGGHGFLDTEESFRTLDVPDSTRTIAFGINDAGQIMGVFLDATGYHGFLATSVPESGPRFDPTGGDELRATSMPEPGTLLLLGAGCVGLLGYGWRQRQQPFPRQRESSAQGGACGGPPARA